jgi:hypothetical protein
VALRRAFLVNLTEISSLSRRMAGRTNGNVFRQISQLLGQPHPRSSRGSETPSRSSWTETGLAEPGSILKFTKCRLWIVPALCLIASVTLVLRILIPFLLAVSSIVVTHSVHLGNDFHRASVCLMTNIYVFFLRSAIGMRRS